MLIEMLVGTSNRLYTQHASALEIEKSCTISMTVIYLTLTLSRTTNTRKPSDVWLEIQKNHREIMQWSLCHMKDQIFGNTLVVYKEILAWWFCNLNSRNYSFSVRAFIAAHCWFDSAWKFWRHNRRWKGFLRQLSTQSRISQQRLTADRCNLDILWETYWITKFEKINSLGCITALNSNIWQIAAQLTFILVQKNQSVAFCHMAVLY